LDAAGFSEVAAKTLAQRRELVAGGPPVWAKMMDDLLRSNDVECFGDYVFAMHRRRCPLTPSRR
jgi:hypothetical protein